jgi:hypothetical protein
MVLYNNGAGRRDAVCNTILTPQRVFASGNERTTVRTNGKYKFGIEYGPADSMGMIYDLMNEAKTRQTYYIEMVSVQSFFHSGFINSVPLPLLEYCDPCFRDIFLQRDIDINKFLVILCRILSVLMSSWEWYIRPS